MECTVWQEHMSTLVDGELGDLDTAALFAHLGQCLQCRNFYRHLTRLREHLAEGARVTPRFPADRDWGTQPSEGKAWGSLRAQGMAKPLRISRALALAAVVALLLLGSSTTVLMIERQSAAKDTRVIYVTALPTIEVEATYLPNETKGL